MNNLNIEKVIQRVLTDEDFANQLKDQAIKALEKGVKSDEWQSYLDLFYTNTEDLAKIKLEHNSLSSEQQIRGTTTTTTVTTTSTGPCTTTTTTTVTTDV